MKEKLDKLKKDNINDMIFFIVMIVGVHLLLFQITTNISILVLIGFMFEILLGVLLLLVQIKKLYVIFIEQIIEEKDEEQNFND
jgi:arginine exporter protein ArgO